MTRDQRFPFRLYLVISEADCWGRSLNWVAEEAILGGVELIQLREKQADRQTFLERARSLKAITDRHGVPLIINDRLDIAQEVSAFGIHVGQQDLPPEEVRRQWPDCRLLGYSVERPSDLEKTGAMLADCLGVSPVFPTSTKPDTVTAWGVDGLRDLRRRTDKPLIAIGGMNMENARTIVEAGADCIAVVSAICRADHPRAAAADLKHTIDVALNTRTR